jgi:hypothetical protein
LMHRRMAEVQFVRHRQACISRLTGYPQPGWVSKSLQVMPKGRQGIQVRPCARIQHRRRRRRYDAAALAHLTFRAGQRPAVLIPNGAECAYSDD